MHNCIFEKIRRYTPYTIAHTLHNTPGCDMIRNMRWLNNAYHKHTAQPSTHSKMKGFGTYMQGWTLNTEKNIRNSREIYAKVSKFSREKKVTFKFSWFKFVQSKNTIHINKFIIILFNFFFRFCMKRILIWKFYFLKLFLFCLFLSYHNILLYTISTQFVGTDEL